MDNFIVIVFIYIKGRKESVILMIKPTHSKVWKTTESNYVALTRAKRNFFINDEVPLCPGKWTNDRIKREVRRYVSMDRESQKWQFCV